MCVTEPLLPTLLDMVEMMLLQNAQMHQVIMQNLMLQAVPPVAPASSRGPQATLQVGSAWSRHQVKDAIQINTSGHCVSV